MVASASSTGPAGLRTPQQASGGAGFTDHSQSRRRRHRHNGPGLRSTPSGRLALHTSPPISSEQDAATPSTESGRKLFVASPELPHPQPSLPQPVPAAANPSGGLAALMKDIEQSPSTGASPAKGVVLQSPGLGQQQHQHQHVAKAQERKARIDQKLAERRAAKELVEENQELRARLASLQVQLDGAAAGTNGELDSLRAALDAQEREGCKLKESGERAAAALEQRLDEAQQLLLTEKKHAREANAELEELAGEQARRISSLERSLSVERAEHTQSREASKTGWRRERQQLLTEQDIELAAAHAATNDAERRAQLALQRKQLAEKEAAASVAAVKRQCHEVEAEVARLRAKLSSCGEELRAQEAQLAAQRTQQEEHEALASAASREIEGLTAALNERSAALQTALEGQQHGERAQALLQEVSEKLKAELASARQELRSGVATWQQERAVHTAALSEREAQLRALEATATRQATELRDLRSQLDSARHAAHDSQSSLSSARTELAETTTARDEATASVAQLRGEVAALAAERETLAVQEQSLSSDLQLRSRELAEAGRMEEILRERAKRASHQIDEMEEAAAVATMELSQWKAGLQAAAAAEAASEAAWRNERSALQLSCHEQVEGLRQELAEQAAAIENSFLPQIRRAEAAAASAESATADAAHRAEMEHTRCAAVTAEVERQSHALAETLEAAEQTEQQLRATTSELGGVSQAAEAARREAQELQMQLRNEAAARQADERERALLETQLAEAKAHGSMYEAQTHAAQEAAVELDRDCARLEREAVQVQDLHARSLAQAAQQHGALCESHVAEVQRLQAALTSQLTIVEQAVAEAEARAAEQAGRLVEVGATELAMERGLRKELEERAQAQAREGESTASRAAASAHHVKELEAELAVVRQQCEAMRTDAEATEERLAATDERLAAAQHAAAATAATHRKQLQLQQQEQQQLLAEQQVAAVEQQQEYQRLQQRHHEQQLVAAAEAARTATAAATAQQQQLVSREEFDQLITDWRLANAALEQLQTECVQRAATEASLREALSEARSRITQQDPGVAVAVAVAPRGENADGDGHLRTQSEPMAEAGVVSRGAELSSPRLSAGNRGTSGSGSSATSNGGVSDHSAARSSPRSHEPVTTPYVSPSRRRAVRPSFNIEGSGTDTQARDRHALLAALGDDDDDDSAGSSDGLPPAGMSTVARDTAAAARAGAAPGNSWRSWVAWSS